MDGNEVNDSNFNQWLDLTLHARANVEPRSGLEERVLARLTIETPRKSFVWWPMFATVAGGFIISLVLLATHSKTQNPQVASGTPLPATTPDTITPPRIQIQSGRMEVKQTFGVHRAADGLTRRAAARQQLPRLATFPSAHPQTAQERLLARLAARRGSFDVASNAEEMVTLKDLSVPELNIRPLEGTPPDKAPRY